MISNEIRESLQRVCFILNKYDVDYLVVGGVAVAYHGYRRISGISLYKSELKTDLDFWYKPSIENFTKLINALIELGVKKDSLNDIIFDPQKTFLKIPHLLFHTDFLPQMKGLDSYVESKKNALKEILDGNELFILGYSDLIRNKMEVGRKIDQSDIVELERIKKNNSSPDTGV